MPYYSKYTGAEIEERIDKIEEIPTLIAEILTGKEYVTKEDLLCILRDYAPKDYSTIPIDGVTIYWDNGVLKSLGSGGGGDCNCLWELRQTVAGQQYLYSRLPVVTQYDVTMYADVGNLYLPDIYQGLPIDGNTIYWDTDDEGNKVLKSKYIEDTGVDASEVLSIVANAGYATKDWVNNQSFINSSFLYTELNKYVKIKDYQEIEGIKNFLNGLQISGLPITKLSGYEDVIYIDANVVVRGGLTMYSTGEVDIPSLTESIVVDNVTLVNDGGVLKINPDIQLGGITEEEYNAIVSMINTKWTQDNNKISHWDTAYGWGNHAAAGYVTLTYLTEELKKYVTLTDYQEIDGVKNFLNGLQISDIPITKLQDDVLYIDSNVVIRGGLTMYYDNGEIDLPSIKDEIGNAGYDGVTGLASFDSSQFVIGTDGTVSIISGSGGLNTEELKSYLDTNKYTTEAWVKAQGYATTSALNAVNTKLNDFLEGSDTDTIINKWKELEAFLSGLSESDNLATILGGKANKATTLAGYGITDAYTKNDVNTLLGNYVTLATTQTITGKKDFTTGGLFVNGKQIQYIPIDSDSGYWKLEGDLLVTGGVTMYADGTTSGGSSAYSTLGSLLNVDDSIDASASVDRVLFQAAGSSEWVTKPLSEIGGGGSGSVSGDYLPLSGGTLTGGLTISPNNGNSYLELVVSSGKYGYIQMDSTGTIGIGSSMSKSLLVEPNGNAILSTTIPPQLILKGVNTESYVIYSSTLDESKSAHSGVVRLSDLGVSASFGVGERIVFPYSGGMYYRNGGYEGVSHAILHAGNYSNYALPLSGGTLSGELTIGNGNDLNLRASSTSQNDAGDIVFKNYNNEEIARIWKNITSQEIFVRFGSKDGGNPILHSGNYSSYALPKDGTAVSASKVTSALSWSGYSSGSYDGSSAKSISIPSNTNQLTNGAGFITSSASITGNAASATKAIQDGNGNVISSTYLPLSGGTCRWINIDFTSSLDSENSVFIVKRKDQGRFIEFQGAVDYFKGVYNFTHTSTNVNIHVFNKGTNYISALQTGSSLPNLDIEGGSVTIGSRAGSRFYFDTKNIRLGIGTPTPRYSLHVNGTMIGTTLLLFDESSGINTYNIGAITAAVSYGLNIEGPTTGTTSSGTVMPIYMTWRGGYSHHGGLRLSAGGNLLVTGGITMYSDIRKKQKLQDVELSLSQIANAPLIEHYYLSDQNKTTHVGSIAQYWAGLNDWFCKLDNEGYYTMEIQNAALASAISIARHLERYESKTDKKIRMLKKRITELEDKIEKLEGGNYGSR